MTEAGKENSTRDGTVFALFDPSTPGRRRRREYHTVLAMIGVFCRGKHGGAAGRGELCAECGELRDYAVKRLSRCVFAEGKPTCQKCPVHCYKPDMRVKIAAVMRYAGPRMAARHPYWALRHLLDGFAAAPEVPGRGRGMV